MPEHDQAGREDGALHAAVLRALVSLVRVYQTCVRPLLGGSCRFHPTCSDYAVEALVTHGVMPGLRLTARRLLRCHPFGSWGFDPVPEQAGSRH